MGRYSWLIIPLGEELSEELKCIEDLPGLVRLLLREHLRGNALTSSWLQDRSREMAEVAELRGLLGEASDTAVSQILSGWYSIRDKGRFIRTLRSLWQLDEAKPPAGLRRRLRDSLGEASVKFRLGLRQFLRKVRGLDRGYQQPSSSNVPEELLRAAMGIPDLRRKALAMAALKVVSPSKSDRTLVELVRDIPLDPADERFVRAIAEAIADRGTGCI